MFHSNVLENVRYGRLDASDEEVMEAARKAHVHDAIARLPEGYKTKVGERGLMISGGEKQRLAVARVLLKDPPILFFDEAVSRTGPDLQTYVANPASQDLRVRCAFRGRADEEHQRAAAGEEPY